MPPSKFRKTVFRAEWSQDPMYAWVKGIEINPYSAWCDVCKQKFELSNMGKQALTSHASGAKHRKRLQAASKSVPITIFCKTGLSKTTLQVKSTDVPEVSSESIQNSSVSEGSKLSPSPNVLKLLENAVAGSACSCICTCTSVEKKSKLLKTYLLNDNVTRAEVMWCLFCVTSHNSLRNAESSVSIQRKMYPDSNIAAKMKLSKAKVSYTIVHGLAPQLERDLKAAISNCSHIVIGFDESLNKVVQKQQMDLTVRYWDDVKNVTCTRYLTSVFLGHSTAADLLYAFKSALTSALLHKILQVSMDGPNVNLRFLKDLREDLKEGRPHEGVILDIGTCGLHSLHCAFKTAMKGTEWEIIPFLRAIHNLFYNIPSRRADFIRITGSDLFPLKFCAVRWLDNVCVANRALKLLPYLLKYIQSLCSKSEPKCASFMVVKNALRDKLLGPKLAFFSSVASEIEPFLKEFQTDKPMAPFLYSDFCAVVKNLMIRFVKPEVIESKPLSAIDLSGTNLMSHKNVDLGFGTKAELRSEKNLTQKDIELFKHECSKCLQELVKKILNRSPLTLSLTRSISFIDPSVVCIPNLANKRLAAALEHFVCNNWISGVQADKICREFKQVCAVKLVQENVKIYTRSKFRLDQFWFDQLKICSFEETKNLASFLKMIFIFSHGNAALERGFSVNKECLVENQQEISLVAQRRIHDSVSAAGGIDDFPVTKQLIHAARNAHSNFKDYLQKQKELSQEKAETNILKRKIAAELAELQARKKKILEDAQNESAILDSRIEALKT
ncbi:uncharacterized protein LOC134529431 [Bacillus rossius redtenbacheri]|uniref:uncharacterized protein LOC134529431 n=1 Tax=Bacillus rossius redtenbacheri TaxID=93214 RepID=UPI002FDE5CD4